MFAFVTQGALELLTGVRIQQVRVKLQVCDGDVFVHARDKICTPVR
jgi:hypothetical protein